MKLPADDSQVGGRRGAVCIKDYASGDNVLTRVNPILTERRYNSIPVAHHHRQRGQGKATFIISARFSPRASHGHHRCLAPVEFQALLAGRKACLKWRLAPVSEHIRRCPRRTVSRPGDRASSRIARGAPRFRFVKAGICSAELFRCSGLMVFKFGGFSFREGFSVGVEKGLLPRLCCRPPCKRGHSCAGSGRQSQERSTI